MSSSGRVFFIAAALALAGCKAKTEPGPPHLYAVLRFENLTGNPEDEWLGRAASEFLSRSLQGALDGPVLMQQTIGRLEAVQGTRPVSTPGISAERSAAIAAGANRLIYGTVTREQGQLTISAAEEDVVTSGSPGKSSARGGNVIDILNRLAHNFSPSARTGIASNPEALKLYAQAAELPFAAAVPKLSQAVTVEPSFGLAWVSLVAASRAVGNREGAAAALPSALKVRLSPLDRANLDMETAFLNNDMTLRSAALRRVAENSPGDTLTQRSIAQQLSGSGDTVGAAAIWKLVVKFRPEDFSAWNELAYASALSGDKAAALEAISKYAKLRPDDVNALDSGADVHYLFGEFREAAKGYLAANTKQSSFLNGGELYKAAWATFKAGDQPAADALFEKFRAAREQAKDTQTLPFYSADWLYRTGRKQQAFAALEQSIAASNDASKSLLASQLAIWLVLEKQRDKAAKVITAGGPIRNASAAAAFFIAQRSQSEASWTALADKIFPLPQAAALHDTALGFALILDNQRAAALPVWKRAMAQKTVLDAMAVAVLRRLEGKPFENPIPPDPVNYSQFNALLDAM